MNHAAAIFWHQGMFLQPQHLQLAELQQQFQRRPLMDGGPPHFWGVGELALSPEAIGNRRIAIQSARLLFPDHSYIEYPGNAVIAERGFSLDWFDADRPLTVHLGLRRLSPGEPNVQQVQELADAAQAGTRYAATYRAGEVADLYADAPPAQVRSLMHVLRIFFDNELAALQGYELLPVARLVRDGDAVRLAEDYAPPCHALAGAPLLLQQLRDIRDELAGRARQLQAYKSPREMQRGSFEASDMVLLLALRSLNRFCPQLQHLSEDPRVHPWVVYGVLRQVVGELSSFSERFNMFGESGDGQAGMPPYDHREIGRCFARAHALISHMLNEITVGAEFIVPLDSDGALLRGQLPKRFFSEHNRFYLRVHSDLEGQSLAQAALRDARLGPTQELPKLLSLSLPGLELIHLPSAPRGLPRHAQMHYFRIEQISQQWSAVERDGEIALAWAGAPDGLKADIVVMRR